MSSTGKQNKKATFVCTLNRNRKSTGAPNVFLMTVSTKIVLGIIITVVLATYNTNNNNIVVTIVKKTDNHNDT